MWEIDTVMCGLHARDSSACLDWGRGGGWGGGHFMSGGDHGH
ncbi:hypothetical protein OKW41_004043 [Paraburkholderia sp. UCT70]